MYYIGCDYFATGEGRTVSLLVTKTATEQEALDQFRNMFGDYYTTGAEVFTKDAFLARWEHFVPDTVINSSPAGAFRWSMQFHLNLS